MGISFINNNKAKASNKLRGALASFIFEQEFGELRSATKAQKDILSTALTVLSDICKGEYYSKYNTNTHKHA